MSKKPVSVYPPDFLAKDIKVGDWVYTGAFKTFAVVEHIIPRVSCDTRVFDRENVLDVTGKLPRKYSVCSPLLVISSSPGKRVAFMDHVGVRFCGSHFIKVTPELIAQFLGNHVRELTSKLEIIKL